MRQPSTAGRSQATGGAEAGTAIASDYCTVRRIITALYIVTKVMAKVPLYASEYIILYAVSLSSGGEHDSAKSCDIVQFRWRLGITAVWQPGRRRERQLLWRHIFRRSVWRGGDLRDFSADP